MINDKQLINKDFALINARYKLSKVQTKMILKVISLIKPNDTDFSTYHLPLSFFDFMAENKNHQRISEECSKLMEKVLHIDTDDGWLKIHWFSSIEYKKKDEIIEIKIDEKLKPYLLQLKKNFKYYELQYVMKMNSEYAIRIYELCKQYERLKTREIILKKLQDLLQVPNSMMKYPHFRQKVLEVAKKEINKYSDIEIDYTPVKRGRSTYKIIFTITENKNNIAKAKAEISEISNNEIPNFEAFRELFAKFKFDLKEFETEFENFKLYNQNNMEKITIDNFTKWCMQLKRKQTEVQIKANNDKKSYKWEFKKAQAVSNKIKDWLMFDLGISYISEFITKGIFEFEISGIKIGARRVMHPDFNKEEIILFKIDDEAGQYLLKYDSDEVIDVEVEN